MSDIVMEVADLAQACGLSVYGLGNAPRFSPDPTVYGPLDSIAILVATLLEWRALAPRRYRQRRIRTKDE